MTDRCIRDKEPSCWQCLHTALSHGDASSARGGCRVADCHCAWPREAINPDD